MKPETLAIHASNLVKSITGDVTLPINLSTTFFATKMEVIRRHMYSRVSNPNRSALENTVAKLEYGEDAAAFSSGNTCGWFCSRL
jgi:cystathionine gamma-synthase